MASRCGPGGPPDVVVFLQQPDWVAYRLKVIEQGELFHSGFPETARPMLEVPGFAVPLAGLVSDGLQLVV